MPGPEAHGRPELRPDRSLRVIGPGRHGAALLVSLEGELDLAGASAFEEAVRAVPGSASVVVDLRSLDYIDSSGIAALLHLDARLKGEGGSLECVVPPEGAVRRVFELIQLSELLELCDDLPGEASPPAA